MGLPGSSVKSAPAAAVLAAGLLLAMAVPTFAGDDAPAGTVPTEATPAEEVAAPPARAGEPTFTIKKFIIEGTTLFPPEVLEQRLKEFTGRRKTAADVEGARDALERFFHDRGYPTVLVNIPEQKVESRVIRLEVIENRIGNLTISGNRWFSSEKIRRDLPSLAPGEILYLPRVQEEVTRINRHPDFKAIPDMQPGKAAESVDFTLKVEDRLPLHGSLELNNRSTHDTTSLRLNAALRYDNLWQREHSVSAQYQLSPQKPSEAEVASGSYTLPSPWDFNDKLVVYGVWSNTKTAYGAGFSNLGKGTIIGGRAVFPLPATGEYGHTAVLGFDYKEFEETVGLTGSEGVKTPVSYLPFSVSYSGSRRDNSGVTQFNAGVVVAFRGAVTDPAQFLDKRFKARGNYIAATAGVERSQLLPKGFSLTAKVDGQLSDQPLISNEQYQAGGIESVRGYKESEASGDNAAHGLFELIGPDLLKGVGRERFSLTPYLFYDAAALWTKEPLPGQEPVTDLQGTGLGVRGLLFRDIDYQVDLAFALRDTSRVTAGDASCHFRVRYQF